MGARRIYSNAGFDLIGTLVTGATGIEFADYLAEAVLGPLRMTGTELAGSPAAAAVGSVDDLQGFVGELMTPTGLLHPDTLRGICERCSSPACSACCPATAASGPTTGGWASRSAARRTRTGPRRATPPAPTVISDAAAPCSGSTRRPGWPWWRWPTSGFGPWAIKAWPQLSDAVLDAFG